MKKFLVFVTLVITFATLGMYSSTQKDVYAQVFEEGWFCDPERNAVMHEVFSDDLSAEPQVTVWTDCQVHQVCAPFGVTSSVHSRNAQCVSIPDPPEHQGTGANGHARPPTVGPNSQITIGVTSDQIIEDRCYDDISLADLRAGGTLTNCSLTSTGCGCVTKNVCVTIEEHDNPDDPTEVTGTHEECHVEDCDRDDWDTPAENDPITGQPLGVNPYDNRQCFHTFTCTSGPNTGNVDIRFEPEREACWTHIRFEVSSPGEGTPPPQHGNCIRGTYPKNNVGTSQQGVIIEDSVSDEVENSQRLIAAYSPESVQEDILRIAENPVGLQNNQLDAPITGVDNIVQNFFCRQGPLQAIFQALGGVCPAPVLYVNNSLNALSATSDVLGNTIRPSDDTVFPSQPQDCAVSDVTNGGQQSDGDAKMREVSSSFGGTDGIYSIYHPDWPEEQLNYSNERNIQIDGTILNGSRLLPDANFRCQLYSQTELPVDNGIFYCNDGTNAPSNIAPTITELPPALECTTACPVGKSGTCGGHQYFVWADNDYGPCQCETEEQTCTP